MKSVQNKVAAITGAGSGIGRAIAAELARRGCHLALSDISEQGLAETAEMVSAHGIRVTTRRLDVSERDEVYDWAQQVVDEHGAVNLLFNNAGVALSATLESVKLEDFEWIMGINFWGVVYGTQAFLPHLKASGDGHIVNISSLFGLIAVPEQGPYNASKFAVRGYTEALRMELELEGAPVSATCVHPGGIATNIAFSARIDADLLKSRGMSADEARRMSNKLLQRTSPRSAAQQILRAVERNARRVLVGPDAKILDKIVRLLGSWYQPLMLRFARTQRPDSARLASARAR
jgi:NAD(P)-dependent dehydrogenase (short-subunit alcohol dehydrogenase family)